MKKKVIAALLIFICSISTFLVNKKQYPLENTGANDLVLASTSESEIKDNGGMTVLEQNFKQSSFEKYEYNKVELSENDYLSCATIFYEGELTGVSFFNVDKNDISIEKSKEEEINHRDDGYTVYKFIKEFGKLPNEDEIDYKIVDFQKATKCLEEINFLGNYDN